MKNRPTTLTHSLCGMLLACMAAVAAAGVKSTKVDPPTITLKRGSTSIAPAPLDMVECEARKTALIALDGATKTTGSGVYDCIYTQRTRIGFGPNPVTPTCTAPKPAQQSQVAQCPAPTVGTWSQTKDYTAAPYPTCWTLGDWTPATAPAGICATPQTLVYACPEAGADGRVLESATISWPNCPSAGLKVPSKSLVVAVNLGAQPHYWRLASKLTSEKIWTQTGTVGAWTPANTIDWGVPPNRAPTISGQPGASVPAGTAYAFTPSAADPDGDPLTFSIANKPSWASFSTSSGKLTGTPAPADVGAYANIGIKVSDGALSVPLPTFAIVVNVSSSGVATLSWTPPTENTNGTPLTNLMAYRIVYGTNASTLGDPADVLTKQVQVSAAVSSYVIESLTAATWYFAVKSVNSDGIESVLSNIASKRIE